MKRKRLKLDLHTHLGEAINFAQPSLKVAQQIMEVIRERSLDGIAITDHDRKDFAFQMKEIIETHSNEVVIIPGQEIRFGIHHVIELYLPGATFRFIAHPGDLSHIGKHLDYIHGVEIENGNWAINKERVTQAAAEYGLLLLSNSDAHLLSDIGRHYNYIDLEELITRAKS